MTKPASRPDRERLAEWSLVAGVVLLLLGLILGQLEAGQDMAKLGGMMILASQVLHPFWRPKWKPPPPPPEPTLGDAGLVLKKGERYVCDGDAAVELTIWWKPMGTSTRAAVLRAGTLVSIDADLAADATHVFVTPADRAGLEAALVEAHERDARNYDGWSIAVSPPEFARRFRRF